MTTFEDFGHLQNLAKRDPASYKDEVLVQYKHFLSELKIFQLTPNHQTDLFIAQIKFLSHVVKLYPKELSDFPDHLIDLLTKHHTLIPQELRLTLAQSLILLRNRNVVPSQKVHGVYFQLLGMRGDKILRNLIYSHLIADIRRAATVIKDSKINRGIQSYIYGLLQNQNPLIVERALEIMIELYNKNVWKDRKTVNMIALGCFSSHAKVLWKALNFFIKSESESNEEENSSDEDEPVSSKSVNEVYKKFSKHSKQTRSKKRKLRDALLKVKKANKKKKSSMNHNGNFTAIQLINDPQELAEKLFGSVKRSNQKFELRLMVLNFISKLISQHKLFVLNFYPYLQRYMNAHQKHITYIFASLAQAVHELIPPDTLEPVVRCIANNFVADRCSSEAIILGLNTIREICVRCPFVMNSTLLHDLVQYKTSKEKGIAMAARSLITFFRTHNPSLLHKKDRGKAGQMSLGVKPLEFGEHRVSDHIEGIELLEREMNGEFESDDEEESDLDQYEIDSEGEEVEFNSDDDIKYEDGEENENEDEDEDEDENENEEDQFISLANSDDSATEEDEEIDEDFLKKIQQKNKSKQKNKNIQQKEEEEDNEEEGEEGEEWEEEEGGEEFEDKEEEEKVEEGEEEEVEEDQEEEEKVSKKVKKEKKKEKVGEKEEKVKMPEASTTSLDMVRILQPEDFEKIKEIKERMELEKLSKGSKRKHSDDTYEFTQIPENLDPGDLEQFFQKRRRTKEERMQSVLAGREGREKFGSRRGEKLEGKSITKQKNRKNKNFIMSIKSQNVRRKKQVSLKQKWAKKRAKRRKGQMVY